MAKSAALVKWDKKFAEKAKTAAAVETLGAGNRFSIKGGKLSFKNVEVPGNAVNVIIVASVFDNEYREGAYDPDVFESPVCFAFGTEEEGMAPHKDAHKPCSKTCAECPYNEFGSASVGKGKACRQARNLCVVSADAESLEDAELAIISVPPTSLKAWKGYVHQLNNTLQRPAMSVVTEVKTVVIGTYPGLEFKLVSEINDAEALDAIEGREEAAMKLLTTPYVYAEPKPKSAPARKTSAKARKF